MEILKLKPNENIHPYNDLKKENKIIQSSIGTGNLIQNSSQTHHILHNKLKLPDIVTLIDKLEVLPTLKENEKKNSNLNIK